MDRKDYLTKLTQEDRELIKLFQDEVDRINLLYMKAVNSNDMTKANQLLKQIKKISNYLNQEYWKRAEVRLPQEYVKGSSYIDEVLQMDSIAIENLTNQVVQSYLEELWPIHIEAVNALVDNSKNYVKASLDWMERQALTMINELQQSQVRQELAKWIISGDSVQSSNKRLTDYFMNQWISWFKDRSWKYWSMDRYIDMLTRTETAIANTQWTINRALELWITKFWIIEKPDCCEVCAEMNGDIVDIRDWVVELPPFHPNCRGYIVAIVDEEEWRNRLIEPEQINQIEDTKALTPEERIKKALDIIENSTMYLKHEQGALIDMNWKIIRMASWLNGSVKLPRAWIEEPYIFTHNHPNSSSFSWNDLDNRLYNNNQYWLRASSKVWIYNLYAERTIDKVLFIKKYSNLERQAVKTGRADLRTLADARKSWSTQDFVKFKDWTYLFYRDNPYKFDKFMDEHYYKYLREALTEAADDTPWVTFEFIESDWVRKDTELNNMYLDKVEEVNKLRRKKIKDYEDNIELNDYL